MAQIQFRSDDTTTWEEGYGDARDGNRAISTVVTEVNTNNTVVISAGAYVTGATCTQFVGMTNVTVLIRQDRGTGAGNWHFNVLLSVTANVGTLKYPSPHAYVDDNGANAAQMILMKQYDTVTVSAGGLASQSWDGNVGGTIPFFAKSLVLSGGYITATGRGFLGGVGQTGDTIGKQGDGAPGAGTNSQAANAGGGGGGARHNPGVYNPSGGGGGGNATAGAVPTNKTNSGSGTAGGTADGNAGLTDMPMGGGGGGGGSKSGTSGAGGNGGGNIIVVAKNITISAAGLYSSGNAGGAPTITTDAGGDGGGGGAGGNILLKCETFVGGTNLLVALAGAGNTSGSHSNAGNGSVGRFHVDYAVYFSGSASPAIDSRQDTSLIDVSETHPSIVPKEIYTMPFYKDTSLVGYWRFNGNSTEEVSALSRTDANINYFSNGMFGHSAHFNGINSKITCSNSTAFDVSTLTISTWIFSHNFAHNGFIFEKGAVNTQYALFLETNYINFRTPYAGFTDYGDISLQSFHANNGIVNGQWNHIAATYDGIMKRIYVNGVLTASVAWSTPLTTGNSEEFIGCYGGAGYGYPLNASLADLSVFNRALSAKEIKYIFDYPRGILEYRRNRYSQSVTGF